jgi:hypothetical protein
MIGFILPGFLYRRNTEETINFYLTSRVALFKNKKEWEEMVNLKTMPLEYAGSPEVYLKTFSALEYTQKTS